MQALGSKEPASTGHLSPLCLPLHSHFCNTRKQCFVVKTTLGKSRGVGKNKVVISTLFRWWWWVCVSKQAWRVLRKYPRLTPLHLVWKQHPTLQPLQTVPTPLPESECVTAAAPNELCLLCSGLLLEMSRCSRTLPFFLIFRPAYISCLIIKIMMPPMI